MTQPADIVADRARFLDDLRHDGKHMVGGGANNGGPHACFSCLPHGLMGAKRFIGDGSNRIVAVEITIIAVVSGTRIEEQHVTWFKLAVVRPAYDLADATLAGNGRKEGGR